MRRPTIREETPDETEPRNQEAADNRVEEITGVDAAVVISQDGLVLYQSGWDTDAADKHAAIGSGLHSLALGVAKEGQRGKVLHQIISGTSCSGRT